MVLVIFRLLPDFYMENYEHGTVVLYFAVHYQQTLQNSIWPTFAANKKSTVRGCGGLEKTQSSNGEPWVCHSSFCLHAQGGKQGWAFCVFFWKLFFGFTSKNIDIFNGWLKPKDSSKIQIKSIYSVRIISIAKRVFRNSIRSNLTESTVVLGIKPSTPIGKIAATIGATKRLLTNWKHKLKSTKLKSTTLYARTMGVPTKRKKFKIFGIEKNFHNISRKLNRFFKMRLSQASEYHTSLSTHLSELNEWKTLSVLPKNQKKKLNRSEEFRRLSRMGYYPRGYHFCICCLLLLEKEI